MNRFSAACIRFSLSTPTPLSSPEYSPCAAAVTSRHIAAKRSRSASVQEYDSVAPICQVAMPANWLS